MAEAVAIRGARRAFASANGAVVALDGVDLSVERGAFVALLGPSGCGKSTLLRLVAGLEAADAGSVETPDARAGQGEIGFVFQDPHLLPWRTVAENVELPLRLRGVPVDERRARTQAALADVELSDARERRPAELSGGMRMRASIARALVTRPRLLLMDEPFAALDELTRHRLDERLRTLWRAQGFTVLFVTHTIFEAVFLAERAVVLARRPGRVVHDAPIALPAERPASIRASLEFAREAERLLVALEGASA